MMYGEHNSSYLTTSSLENGPYSSSLASSASSSSSSVWSETSSQTSYTSIQSTSDSEHCDATYQSLPSQRLDDYAQEWALRLQTVEVPERLRQNSRRTRNSAINRNGPPSLTRQSDRKVNFVENLVDSSTQIVEAIWPLASVFHHQQQLGSKAVLPLRTFIQETLRRSRTSYSTLQVALYYLILIKPHVPSFDFTMEQSQDLPVIRALQCGRRMFLAALILASKYLQDRNYSARAWSKISGLATQEINQNEMAFLCAVNWKLHITDAIFKRWTEIILKHTPSQSPPPPPGTQYLQAPEKQFQDWKNLILQLNPGLDNIEHFIPVSPSRRTTLASLAESPCPSLSSTPRARPTLLVDGFDATPTPKGITFPTVMEPVPVGGHTRGRQAPALGLLPTPRMTPQLTGLCTPAASAATSMLGAKRWMSFAIAQADQMSASQNLDKWPGSVSTSPCSYMLSRRPSLANSISSASSPESMISDSSRTSRSSSISSVSSQVSAPLVKLDVQARCRNAKLYGGRCSMKTAIASVPEDYEEDPLLASPESYTSTVKKDMFKTRQHVYQANVSETPWIGCKFDREDAARSLQKLKDNDRSIKQEVSTGRSDLKRSRRVSADSSLQEHVRLFLDRTMSSRLVSGPDMRQMPIHTSHDGCRKRVCSSTKAAQPCTHVLPAIHPAAGGPGGPGMWEGVLN